jgi:hypothetical protein
MLTLRKANDRGHTDRRLNSHSTLLTVKMQTDAEVLSFNLA